MSDDDWESAADAGADELPVVKRWEGEDEEEPAAESWDEDPEEKKRKAQAAAAAANANKAPQGPVLSQRKKKLAEEEEKKRKEKEVRHTHTRAHTCRDGDAAHGARCVPADCQSAGVGQTRARDLQHTPPLSRHCRGERQGCSAVCGY